MHASVGLIIGVVSFCVSLAGAIVANGIVMAMIGDLNRLKKDEQRLTYLGFHPRKNLLVVEEHARAYPGSQRRRALLAAVGLMGLGLVTAAVALGIVRPR